MGNCPDWNRQNYKKVNKMADGGSAELPDLGYNPEREDYESPVELSYEAGGKGLGENFGYGRVGARKNLEDDSSIGVGVSGSHWKAGKMSGQNLEGVDATYSNKQGSFGVGYEPRSKKVQFTFYKEF